MNLGSFWEDDDDGEEKESQHVQLWRSASCFIIGPGAGGFRKTAGKPSLREACLAFAQYLKKR